MTAIWIEASLWWVEQRSPLSFFSLRYTTNQAIGKVPKLISTAACRDTPVTVGRLGNVRSGKQAMLTRDQALGYKRKERKKKKKKEKKKETNQLNSEYLICLRRWLDYQ